LGPIPNPQSPIPICKGYMNRDYENDYIYIDIFDY
jgi:hypothetical protein